MGFATILLIGVGAVLGAGAMTMLLDAFATCCFRPLQTIEASSAQTSTVNS